jgi:hypothetical protein
VSGKRGSLAERFWAKVERRGPTECWEWRGARKPKGYGSFRIGNRVDCAHWVAYRLAVGEVPAGLQVLHSCDNPPCCNPAHLRPGTPLENTRDSIIRGRRRKKAA